MTTTMTCPKCRGEMASYERNGVLVDQCGDCRGLFLDRGELEHLITAEASFGRAEPSFSRAETSRADFGDRSTPPDQRFHRQPQKRKKRSLFEDLFD
jgi:hypothetical protein